LRVRNASEERLAMAVRCFAWVELVVNLVVILVIMLVIFMIAIMIVTVRVIGLGEAFSVERGKDLV
jgi:hypothetical protein